LETKFILESAFEFLFRDGIFLWKGPGYRHFEIAVLSRDVRHSCRVGNAMRKRLGRLAPIVMIAVLVQFLAPIVMMRVASAAQDPFGGAIICAAAHGGDAAADVADAAHGTCCPLCVVAHAATPLDHPDASYVAIQRDYQRIVWLENRTPDSDSALAERPHARGPPLFS
jgi:hypothetical protein